MSINPDSCEFFIQVWVNVNLLKQGSTDGCYAFCNSVFSEEAQAELNTPLNIGSKICLSVLPIDPQFANMITINKIGNGFGWETPPDAFNGSKDVFTAELTKNMGEEVNSNIEFTYKKDYFTELNITVPVTIMPSSS